MYANNENLLIRIIFLDEAYTMLFKRVAFDTRF